jgi:hypothetical protein
MVWGVEKERFRNDLSTAIPTFVGIAAFATEGSFSNLCEIAGAIHNKTVHARYS